MSESLRFDIFAKDEFSKSFDKLKDKLPSLKTLAIGAAGGLAAIGTSLLAITKTTATAYDQIGKFAQQTGLTTEFLSKMNVAANFADVNINTMNKSVERLQVTIGEAAKGIGLGKDTLQAFGIELHKDNGILKTAEDILPELADKFRAMGSATERTEAAQKLFGQRGIEMIKILKDGSEGLAKYSEEAEAMGLVVDKQAAANAAKFNDALYKVKGTLTGLKNEIGERVMPIITGLAEKFSSFVKNNRDKIIDFGNTTLQVMNGIVEKMAYGVGILVDSWRGLQMTWEVIKIGMNELAKFLVQSIDWIIQKMTGLMEAINFRGVFDEEIERANRWSETMKMGIETFQESADAARENLQNLISEGMATEKVDQFIEKTHLAIEAIRQEGEAEVEVVAEKNEQLLSLEQEYIERSNEQQDAHIKAYEEYQAKKVKAQETALNKMAAIGSALGKKMFKISQAAGIAEATMNTYRAVAEAIKNPPGPPWSFAYGAAALAYGMAQVAGIANQTYAAHGGMTNVPKEQTMLLDKGERILSPNQNRDFTEFINNGGGAGSVVIQNMNILPNATNAEMLLTLNKNDWDEIVEYNILPSIRRLTDRGFAIA